jgi:hypothetical protein
MLQRIADETKLNCKCLVLQSHLEAMLKKLVTLIPNTSKTKSITVQKLNTQRRGV